MAITLILGKAETDFVRALDGSYKQLPRFSSDEERHDFVIQFLDNIDFDKLIILIDSEDGYDDLKLGLHIRLTVQLAQKRFVPILFVASESLKIILRQTGTWGRILTTKGCSLLPVDVQAVQDGSTIPSLAPAEFSEFLRRIQLQPDETIGRHSLANQWGAYALDKAAHTNALLENKSLIKARKQLYFKYVESLNSHSIPVPKATIATVPKNQNKTIQIEAQGKKILLIDDEADKGWSDVLRQLFKTATDFAVLNRKVSGWSSFSTEEKDYILKTGFDLFLIDLRMTGTEEEETVEAAKFSGTEVMQEIKKSNKGNQVIIFTASNKAWNLKALLNLGADGYYIKESPEYNFSESFSVENFNSFKKEAGQCLEYSFLKSIWDTYKKNLDKLDIDEMEDKYDEQLDKIRQIRNELLISCELISQKKSGYINYFAITYVRILELFADMFTEIDNRSRLVYFSADGTEISLWSWDTRSHRYSLRNFQTGDKWDQYKSIFNRVVSILHYKFNWDPNRSDKSDVQALYKLIDSRNKFVHEGQGINFDSNRILKWTQLLGKILQSL